MHNAHAPLTVSNLAVFLGGSSILSDISFKVNPGRLCRIQGENGSGKTTLLNVISGLIPPTTGRVELFSTNIRAWSPDRIARFGVGRLFQRACTPDDFLTWQCFLVVLTATGYLRPLSTAATLDQCKPAVVDAGGEAALELLRTIWDVQIGNLSFAQQRLVETVCCLVVGSRLLLLDEPLAGSDANTCRIVVSMVANALSRERTIVVVEHQREWLNPYVSQDIVLKNGHIESNLTIG